MNDDYQFPVPAYTPVGWAILAVAFVWALTVRAGSLLYAGWLAWGWGRRDE